MNSWTSGKKLYSRYRAFENSKSSWNIFLSSICSETQYKVQAIHYVQKPFTELCDCRLEICMKIGTYMVVSYKEAACLNVISGNFVIIK